MQTFAIFFVLSALGGKYGTVAITVYVLLGAVGIPVFSQFTSGIGIATVLTWCVIPFIIPDLIKL